MTRCDCPVDLVWPNRTDRRTATRQGRPTTAIVLTLHIDSCPYAQHAHGPQRRGLRKTKRT
jgi:hypothetical protein